MLIAVSWHYCIPIIELDTADTDGGYHWPRAVILLKSCGCKVDAERTPGRKAHAGGSWPHQKLILNLWCWNPDSAVCWGGWRFIRRNLTIVLFLKCLWNKYWGVLNHTLVFWNRVFCSIGWPWTHVAEDDFELRIFLPLPTKYWDYRKMPLCLDLKYHFKFLFVVSFCFVMITKLPAYRSSASSQEPFQGHLYWSPHTSPGGCVAVPCAVRTNSRCYM